MFKLLNVQRKVRLQTWSFTYQTLNFKILKLISALHYFDISDKYLTLIWCLRVQQGNVITSNYPYIL